MLFITIGESPRDDVVPELIDIIGKRNISYREIGLIDNVDSRLYTPLNLQDILVSRKRDGSIAYVSHKWVSERLANLKLNDLGILLCTDDFENDRLILPYRVVRSFFKALPKLDKMTVVVPEEDQRENAIKRWNNISNRLSCIAFSPYKPQMKATSFDLRDEQLVYLDCIGFSLQHEKFFKDLTKGIVISARRILGNYLRCLIS